MNLRLIEIEKINKRAKSKIGIASVIFAILFILKSFYDIEIDEGKLEGYMIIGYAIWNIISAYSDPKK